MQLQETSDQTENFVQQLIDTKRMTSLLDSYVIDINNKVSTSKTSLRFYAHHFLMAAILEAFITKEYLTLKELNQLTWNNIPKSLAFSITISDYHSSLIKMVRLGYLVTTESTEHNLPLFKITEIGIQSLQNQSLQNLASASFFNHQAFGFNKKAFVINLLAILVAFISLVIAIVALFW